MIPEKSLEVFWFIYRRLGGEEINWVLTGSLAFAMQGLPLTPRDIDIQTDRQGAYRFGELFAEFVTHPVGTDRAGERLRSHFGDFQIEGVQVQVMGDLQKRESPEHEWEPPTDLDRHKRWLEFGGMRLAVLDLEYEAESYRKMGRLERAELLRSYANR